MVVEITPINSSLGKNEYSHLKIKPRHCNMKFLYLHCVLSCLSNAFFKMHSLKYNPAELKCALYRTLFSAALYRRGEFI